MVRCLPISYSNEGIGDAAESRRHNRGTANAMGIITVLLLHTGVECYSLALGHHHHYHHKKLYSTYNDFVFPLVMRRLGLASVTHSPDPQARPPLLYSLSIRHRSLGLV